MKDGNDVINLVQQSCPYGLLLENAEKMREFDAFANLNPLKELIKILLALVDPITEKKLFSSVKIYSLRPGKLLDISCERFPCTVDCKSHEFCQTDSMC